MKDFSKGYRFGKVIYVITNMDGVGFVQTPTVFLSINKAKFANRSLKLPTASKIDKLRSVCMHCGTVTGQHVDTCIMNVVQS